MSAPAARDASGARRRRRVFVFSCFRVFVFSCRACLPGGTFPPRRERLLDPSCHRPPCHFARHDRTRHAARGVSPRVARRARRDGIDRRGRLSQMVDVDVAGRSFSVRSAPLFSDQRFCHRPRRAKTRHRTRGVWRVRARGRRRRLASARARVRPHPAERRSRGPVRVASTRVRRRFETRFRFPSRSRGGGLLRAGRPAPTRAPAPDAGHSLHRPPRCSARGARGASGAAVGSRAKRAKRETREKERRNARPFVDVSRRAVPRRPRQVPTDARGARRGRTCVTRTRGRPASRDARRRRRATRSSRIERRAGRARERFWDCRGDARRGGGCAARRGAGGRRRVPRADVRRGRRRRSRARRCGSRV